MVVGLGGACPCRGGGVAGHGNTMDAATTSIGIGRKEKWELAYSDGTAPLLLACLVALTRDRGGTGGGLDL